MVRDPHGANHEAPVSDQLSLFPGSTSDAGGATPDADALCADEQMRRDVTDVLAGALRAGQRAFLLVNNKAEGSAPLTIEAIAARLVENGV